MDNVSEIVKGGAMTVPQRADDPAPDGKSAFRAALKSGFVFLDGQHGRPPPVASRGKRATIGRRPKNST